MPTTSFSRREFLHRAARLTAAAAAGWPLASMAEAANDAWQKAFLAQSQQGTPWCLGYRTPAGDLAGDAVSVEGRFPAAVCGTLYRNGPAGHDLGGVRYHHWFDGDGMIQRFTIAPDGVRHLGRFIRTDKFNREQAARQRLVETFGTKLPDLIPVTSGDNLNVANTSVVLHHGELLALWEGGSASRLDPATLDCRGIVTWRDDLAGVPFSAHPRIDTDGTVWNFGVASGQDRLIVYQIDPAGQLKKAEALPVADVPMIHDFLITERHLVFVMPPLVFDRTRFGDHSFLDSHVWRPDLGMRVLVIDKNDWQKRQILELPAGFLFHLGNAWEDQSGVIRLDYVHADTPDVIFVGTRNVMRGEFTDVVPSELVRVTLDLGANRARRESLGIDGEFPQVERHLTGRQYHDILHAQGHMDHRPGFNAVAITSVDTARSQRYVYGDDVMVEEHLFVAAEGGRRYVLGTALDLKRRCTLLSCFDAQSLSAGPIAQARLPYALPLGLHGTFVPAAV